jgi:D-amino peptidase
MEGVAGVVHDEETEAGKPDYPRFRKLMTQEVNAAIAGAREAGAQEFVVNDAHWTMRNLLAEELDPAAELISGYPKAMFMTQGMGPNFDAAFFIGYHASAGTRDAVLAHTYAGFRTVLETRLNGVPQSEGSLNAALCGYYGCPLALFTGDSAAVAEMHGFVLEVEGIVLKEGVSMQAARSLSPEVARERIRSGAQRALERLDNIPPLRLEGPFELEIDFGLTSMADQCELVPGVRRPGPRTIAYTSQDYVELYRLMLALVLLAESAT